MMWHMLRLWRSADQLAHQVSAPHLPLWAASNLPGERHILRVIAPIAELPSAAVQVQAV